MGSAGDSAGRDGPGARARPASPGQPGLAAAARRGGGGHHRGRILRLRPGPAGGPGQPPGRDRARGRAVAGRAVAAPGHRAAAEPAGRGPPGAGRDGRLLLRAGALHHHPAGAGLAVAAPAGRVRAAALGAGAGHHRRQPGVLDLAGRPAPVRRAGHDRRAGPLPHPRRRPHGPDSLVNLYAAMPSLHVAWAAWCAVAIVTATRGRWRHLAWFYPAATTVVVLASANHFVLDAAAGLAVMAAGLLATRRRAPGHAPARPP